VVAAEGSELLKSLVVMEEALKECLVPAAAAVLVLDSVEGEEPLKAHGCQQTVEARQTCLRPGVRRRVLVFLVAVEEVEDLDLQHWTTLLFCLVGQGAGWQTFLHLQLEVAPGIQAWEGLEAVKAREAVMVVLGFLRSCD